MRWFHVGVLCFAGSEYLLWTVGCFRPDTSPASPAFWCDMLLTLAILGLLPAARKGGERMTYIENIFLRMVSPLLATALCVGRRQLRFFLFCIAGMGGRLLSACINTFFAAAYRADAIAATVEIAPVVEEAMKLLPLAFYLPVFEPEGEEGCPFSASGGELDRIFTP